MPGKYKAESQAGDDAYNLNIQESFTEHPQLDTTESRGRENTASVLPAWEGARAPSARQEVKPEALVPEQIPTCAYFRLYFPLSLGGLRAINSWPFQKAPPGKPDGFWVPSSSQQSASKSDFLNYLSHCSPPDLLPSDQNCIAIVSLPVGLHLKKKKKF